MSHLYVIQFSTFVIKVGITSGDPDQRISEHVARFAPAGVAVLFKRWFKCVGEPLTSEMNLIRFCSERCSERRGREWFYGLEFESVCDEAARISSGYQQEQQVFASVPGAELALEEAIDVAGGFSRLASLLGVAPSAPSMWKKRRNVPAEYCPAIERETARLGHRVMCERLRPDVDWAVLREFAQVKAGA